MMMGRFHSASLRYALALWLATVLALLVSFEVQLEPAQWSAITVWIIFIQTPRMNYSKILWWSFGTVTGAAMAVILTVCFSQTPELFLLFLAIWLAGCAAWAPLVSHYRAYGAVLAGYTCAIISLSAVDHPALIFQLAATRVSCIFIGMASAILLINILLPRPRHWQDTRRHLAEHLKATLLQAAKAMNTDGTPPAHFAWRHLVERLATLEHTLDITTAESADSRLHAPQVRRLLATLFVLLAKAQAIEVHVSRAGSHDPAPEVKALLRRANALLTAFATTISTDSMKFPAKDRPAQIKGLRDDLTGRRGAVAPPVTAGTLSNQFLLDRLDEMLEELAKVIQDWSGLFGPWTARRATHLARHKDYRSACIYGLRMFLAMTLAGVLWFITQWPSGPQFILFIAIVCSLLSLVDDAPLLGWPFLKSAVFCALMAYFETFWLDQKCESFLGLACLLGFFLLPAAYAYRHPRLIGGAVVSMLIFYGLSNPANQMNYDIAAFLNNGLALLVATAGGFFAFHAVPSPDTKARCFWLFRAVRRELAGDDHAHGALAEQRWTTCMFDRLRLLHRAAGHQSASTDWLEAENEMLINLQLGLRQRGLRAYLSAKPDATETARVVSKVLEEVREISRHPNTAALLLRSSCLRFQDHLDRRGKVAAGTLGALAEMWELTLLLETSTRFYPDQGKRHHA